MLFCYIPGQEVRNVILSHLDDMATMLFCHTLDDMATMLFCHFPEQEVRNVILSHPWMIWQQCYLVTPGQDGNNIILSHP